MRKNWLFTVSLAAVVVLSACSPTPSATPVPTPGVTFVPKGTRETAQSSVTPTPRPLGAPVLVDRMPARGAAAGPAARAAVRSADGPRVR